MVSELEKLKVNAKYGTMGIPPEPKEVSREEGQCGWCSFRATDVCELGHNVDDHCNCMGHRGLKCNGYKWCGTSKEKVDTFLTRQELAHRLWNYKWCKCMEKSRYDRLYMKIFRWFKDWQFNRQMRKCEEETIKEMKSMGLDPIALGDTGIMEQEFEGELLSIKREEEG